MDRLIIVRTGHYTEDEIRELISVRAREESVRLGKDALDYLTKIGLENGLRYAAQLLTPAQIRTKEQNGDSVTKDDV